MNDEARLRWLLVIEILNSAAIRAQTAPAQVIAEHRWLGAAIDEDAAADRFRLWGASTVIDEHTGSAVIGAELFDALHERAGIAARWPVGNAGLLHVYGYLLSIEPTPYGLKRARWLEGTLAGAFGLSADTFVPWAHSATALDRVSGAALAFLAEGAARTGFAAGRETTLALGRTPAEGPWALVYTVDGLLVTSFAVESPETVLAEWDADPARLRWNAAV